MDRFELLYGLLDLESSRISSSTQNCIHIHIKYASGFTVDFTISQPKIDYIWIWLISLKHLNPIPLIFESCVFQWKLNGQKCPVFFLLSSSTSNAPDPVLHHATYHCITPHPSSQKSKIKSAPPRHTPLHDHLERKLLI